MKRIVVSIFFVLVFSVAALAENTPMRFGVLPVLDTLPLQVAAQDGLFEKHGLDVELVKFMSALERDTAMQTGQIDGYFGDLIATYLLISRDVPMRIALTSWRTTPGYPMFGIALSPEGRERSLDDMKGRKLGLSKSTIMEFLADKMEDRLGVESGYFERMEIKKMPIRFQMLVDQSDRLRAPARAAAFPGPAQGRGDPGHCRGSRHSADRALSCIRSISRIMTRATGSSSRPTRRRSSSSGTIPRITASLWPRPAVFPSRWSLIFRSIRIPCRVCPPPLNWSKSRNGCWTRGFSRSWFLTTWLCPRWLPSRC